MQQSEICKVNKVKLQPGPVSSVEEHFVWSDRGLNLTVSQVFFMLDLFEKIHDLEALK